MARPWWIVAFRQQFWCLKIQRRQAKSFDLFKYLFIFVWYCTLFVFYFIHLFLTILILLVLPWLCLVVAPQNCWPWCPNNTHNFNFFISKKTKGMWEGKMEENINWAVFTQVKMSNLFRERLSVTLWTLRGFLKVTRALTARRANMAAGS